MVGLGSGGQGFGRRGGGLVLARRVAVLGMVRVMGEDPVGDPARVRRSAEDFARVGFEHLDPGLNIAYVIWNVARQIERATDEIACQFCAQLFARICCISESAGEIAVETVRRPARMRQFMLGSVFEASFLSS